VKTDRGGPSPGRMQATARVSCYCPSPFFAGWRRALPPRGVAADRLELEGEERLPEKWGEVEERPGGIGRPRVGVHEHVHGGLFMAEEKFTGFRSWILKSA